MELLCEILDWRADKCFVNSEYMQPSVVLNAGDEIKNHISHCPNHLFKSSAFHFSVAEHKFIIKIAWLCTAAAIIAKLCNFKWEITK